MSDQWYHFKNVNDEIFEVLTNAGVEAVPCVSHLDENCHHVNYQQIQDTNAIPNLEVDSSNMTLVLKEPLVKRKKRLKNRWKNFEAIVKSNNNLRSTEKILDDLDSIKLIEDGETKIEFEPLDGKKSTSRKPKDDVIRIYAFGYAKSSKDVGANLQEANNKESYRGASYEFSVGGMSSIDPTGKGLPIYFEGNDIPFAEIMPKQVYLLRSFHYSSSHDHIKFLKLILPELINYARKGEAELKKIAQRIQDDELIDFFSKNFKRAIEETKETIEEKKNDAKKYRKLFIEREKSVIVNSAKLKGLQESKVDAKKAREALEELRKTPMLKDLTVIRGNVKAITNLIHIEDVPIGEFEIIISEDELKVRNLDPLILKDNGRTIHHPHYGYHSADMCWGNVGDLINKLIAKCDYINLISLVIACFQKYDVDGEDGHDYGVVFEHFKERYLENQKKACGAKKEEAVATA